jgi:hypothetical protein
LFIHVLPLILWWNEKKEMILSPDTACCPGFAITQPKTTKGATLEVCVYVSLRWIWVCFHWLEVESKPFSSLWIWSKTSPKQNSGNLSGLSNQPVDTENLTEEPLVTWWALWLILWKHLQFCCDSWGEELSHPLSLYPEVKGRSQRVRLVAVQALKSCRRYQSAPVVRNWGCKTSVKCKPWSWNQEEGGSQCPVLRIIAGPEELQEVPDSTSEVAEGCKTYADQPLWSLDPIEVRGVV